MIINNINEDDDDDDDDDNNDYNDNDYYDKVGYTDVLQMGTYPTSSETVTISISGTTGSKGSGNSHENRPPYYALTYIIKT